MNIPDTVNTPVSSAALPAATVTQRVEEKSSAADARETRAQTDVREVKAVGPALTVESRDRFTASVVPVSNALYDVTRIRRGSHQQLAVNIIATKTLHGERVTRKMADIPLATGRNLLHIYQKDNKA